MSDDLTPRADEMLERALTGSGGRDPRALCRERLRELKRADPSAYDKAVAYYRDVLIPTVATGEADPLDAWTEYGRRLAQSLAAGRTVAIDATGRSRAFERPDRSTLVLHLPDAPGGRALLVAEPTEPSPAQQATHDALVAGKQKLANP